MYLKIFLSLLAAVLLAGCGMTEPESSGTQESQKAALMKFYETTGGDNWKENRNWGSDRPLEDWFGIKTAGGHITEIELTGNHLEGSLPDDLFSLVSLERLVLDSPKHHNTLDSDDLDNWNLISGNLNELGPKIGRLTNLKELNFRGLVNITCGDIPDEIWMPRIEKIDLCQISVKGRISSAIGNATNLKYLDISRNNAKTDLHGTIPAEITKLKNLETINVGSNRHLTGTIPENIGDMESLQRVKLDGCALTGTLPKSIFKLKRLHSLDVSSNFLEGEFDLSSLVEFPNLDYFAIVYNMYLQGTGNVPEGIRTVWFNRDNYDLNYNYGEIYWANEKPYYNTPEMLEERLAEK